MLKLAFRNSARMKSRGEERGGRARGDGGGEWENEERKPEEGKEWRGLLKARCHAGLLLIYQRFPKEKSVDCVYPKMPWQSEQTQQGVGHTGAKSVTRVETVSLLWCHW